MIHQLAFNHDHFALISVLGIKLFSYLMFHQSFM